jgi:hypothetical protein
VTHAGRALLDQGYVAVDALVALLLVCMSLGFGFQAVQQAMAAARSASEVQRAQLVLTHVMETAPRAVGLANGSMDGFEWTLETHLTGAERPIAVCRRAAAARHAVTGRIYAAETLETCPPTDS